MERKIRGNEEMEDLGNKLCEYCEIDPRNPDCSCSDEYCEEAYAAYLKENAKGAEAEAKMRFELDTEALGRNIISSVKAELKNEILSVIRSEAQGLLKAEIEANVTEIVKDYVRELFEQEVIQVGGGWDKEAKTYTIKEYAKRQIKDIITKNKLEKEPRKSNDYYSKEQTFEEYFVDNCISPEIRKEIDKRLKNVQMEINTNLKKVFDTQLEAMLSEVALGILKTSATYADLKTKLGLPSPK